MSQAIDKATEVISTDFETGVVTGLVCIFFEEPVEPLGYLVRITLEGELISSKVICNGTTTIQ